MDTVQSPISPKDVFIVGKQYIEAYNSEGHSTVHMKTNQNCLKMVYYFIVPQMSKYFYTYDIILNVMIPLLNTLSSLCKP